MLPVKPRRYRYPGRKRLGDRACLNGIPFVLKTGIPWQDLPQQLGYGSGMTCWRRLRNWKHAGVWEQLHQLLLTRFRARRKTAHGSGLGRQRYVVERSIAWLHGYRRLRIRWSTAPTSTRHSSRLPAA